MAAAPGPYRPRVNLDVLSTIPAFAGDPQSGPRVVAAGFVGPSVIAAGAVANFLIPLGLVQAGIDLASLFEYGEALVQPADATGQLQVTDAVIGIQDISSTQFLRALTAPTLTTTTPRQACSALTVIPQLVLFRDLNIIAQQFVAGGIGVLGLRYVASVTLKNNDGAAAHTATVVAVLCYRIITGLRE